MVAVIEVGSVALMALEIVRVFVISITIRL